MQNRTLRLFCSATLFAAALPVVAGQAEVDALKKQFASVRSLELPARTASVVTAAPAAERSVVASDAVTAALAVNASSGPLVVGSVSRANPDAAASAAVAAAKAQPKQVARVTKAAVGGAPDQVETIVASLIKAQPASFFAVGVSAAEVAPKSGDAILGAISSASPALKTLIKRANPELTPAKDVATVAAILKRADTLVASLSKSTKSSADTILAGEITPEMASKLPTSMGPLAASVPTVGPPYTPGSASPGEISTANTFNAPAGYRYSSP